MRKIVANLFMSLDGVVAAPETWTGPYFTEDIGQLIESEMAGTGILLTGRRTYETFAASFAHQSGGMADRMNTIPKIVVSTTLTTADWQNTTVVGTTAELAVLKEQPGDTIAMSGSAGLVRSLLRDGLLDELRLLLFPVIVGQGTGLFDGIDKRLSFELLESRTFTGGVVRLTYRPAR